jgi:tRNA 2-thiouridine synthesizing protein A
MDISILKYTINEGAMTNPDRKLDASGMRCPIPVLRGQKEIKAMKRGEVIEIIATDGQAPRDFRDFCEAAGHTLLASEERDNSYVILIQKG